MLTDIFAYRYLDHPIWASYSEIERRLLVQTFGIAKDALPYYDAEGREIENNKQKWQTLHDMLARELGVNELSQRYYYYTQKNAFGQELPVSGYFSWDCVCEQFVNETYTGQYPADRYIKERISLIELALRLRGEEVTEINAKLGESITAATFQDAIANVRYARKGMTVPGSAVDGVKAWNLIVNQTFESQVAELNERFRRARVPLTYHNGFIQLAMDSQIEKHIAKPFWDLVADPLWENVDIDMKEALDRRDANDKDPAIFAAKALESAIKIISELKGWTRGTESGASQFIDNLVSKANGSYLSVWEGEMLKDYFRKVRNSVGHGPGSEPMPELTLPQTDWAIESAMSWVRTLVRRI